MNEQKVQIEESNRRLVALQQEKSNAEHAATQLGTELGRLQSRHEQMKAEKTNWELGFADYQRANIQLQNQLHNHKVPSKVSGLELERAKGENNRLKEQYNRDKANWDKERVTIINSSQAQLEDAERRHEANTKQMESQYKRQLEKARKEERILQSSKIERLENLTQDLTADLLKRDHISSLKDRDVIRMFQTCWWIRLIISPERNGTTNLSDPGR